MCTLFELPLFSLICNTRSKYIHRPLAKGLLELFWSNHLFWFNYRNLWRTFPKNQKKMVSFCKCRKNIYFIFGFFSFFLPTASSTSSMSVRSKKYVNSYKITAWDVPCWNTVHIDPTMPVSFSLPANICCGREGEAIKHVSLSCTPLFLSRKIASKRSASFSARCTLYNVLRKEAWLPISTFFYRNTENYSWLLIHMQLMPSIIYMLHSDAKLLFPRLHQRGEKSFHVAYDF